jgi:hypothetical protein
MATNVRIVTIKMPGGREQLAYAHHSDTVGEWLRNTREALKLEPGIGGLYADGILCGLAIIFDSIQADSLEFLGAENKLEQGQRNGKHHM